MSSWCFDLMVANNNRSPGSAPKAHRHLKHPDPNQGNRNPILHAEARCVRLGRSTLRQSRLDPVHTCGVFQGPLSTGRGVLCGYSAGHSATKSAVFKILALNISLHGQRSVSGCQVRANHSCFCRDNYFGKYLDNVQIPSRCCPSGTMMWGVYIHIYIYVYSI